MNTQEVYDRLAHVKREIDLRLNVHNGFRTTMIDPDEIELESPDNPNEIQKRNALFGMLDKLEDVCRGLEYLSRPILDCGVLHRNENGRLELNGREFTSGESIEVLIMDPEGEEPSYWFHTRIEYDIDYYAVNVDSGPDGLMARIR